MGVVRDGDLALTARGDLEPHDGAPDEEMRLRLLCERGTAFWDKTFGSRLAALARSGRRTPALGRELEAAVREALDPMVSAGRLKRVLVTVTVGDLVAILVTGEDAARRPFEVPLFVEVG